MKLSKQKCNNCKYARASTFPNKDGKEWLSCRFTPPVPGEGEVTEYKTWRIVPEDFWCSKWEEYFD